MAEREFIIRSDPIRSVPIWSNSSQQTLLQLIKYCWPHCSVLTCGPIGVQSVLYYLRLAKNLRFCIPGISQHCDNCKWIASSFKGTGNVLSRHIHKSIVHEEASIVREEVIEKVSENEFIMNKTNYEIFNYCRLTFRLWPLIYSWTFMLPCSSSVISFYALCVVRNFWVVFKF